MNKPLTTLDLQTLESILMENGVCDPQLLQLAAKDARGLGVFVRSLVRLDRSTAKEALGTFLADQTLGQIRLSS